MHEKITFPPIEPNSPPDQILKAWTRLEIVMGEPLSREEMATASALTVMGYIARLTPEQLQKITATVSTVMQQVEKTAKEKGWRQ